jgi:hypothetical protein
MMSSEDGLSVLRKMRDESSRLWVRFIEDDIDEQFLSFVCEVTEDTLILYKYAVACLTVGLQRIEFAYADPREAEEPEKAARIYEYCLELSWPNGSLCRLNVMRDDLTPPEKPVAKFNI